MTPFNSRSFPDSLAIAKEASLTIGSIDEVQKLHIRTVALGHQPRRICHLEAAKAFLLATSPNTFSSGMDLPDLPSILTLLDHSLHSTLILGGVSKLGFGSFERLQDELHAEYSKIWGSWDDHITKKACNPKQTLYCASAAH